MPTKASNDGKPTPSVYSAHRARQRDRILAAAEKIFAARGIDRVTVAELTTASGVQPSTMYQYFSKKDEIVWAIVDKILAKISADAKKKNADRTSGLSKLEGFLEYMAEELASAPDQVRFMAQFDVMYARNGAVERLLVLEGEKGDAGRDFFRTVIREGIADGALRPDLDPEVTMQAVMNAAIGTQRRLASLDQKVELEYGVPIDRLFREAVRILLMGLRASPRSEPPG